MTISRWPGKRNKPGSSSADFSRYTMAFDTKIGTSGSPRSGTCVPKPETLNPKP